MAERIEEEFDWEAPRESVPHPSAYPWPQWCDGSTWRIRQGEDYTAKTTSMVSMLQRAARERGLKVRVRPDWDPGNPGYAESITFQFRKANGQRP